MNVSAYIGTIDCCAVTQSNHGRPVRIVNVSSKMHELAPGFDTADPHFGKQGAYSSLAAYNRSKLAQVIFWPYNDAGHDREDATG